MKKVALKLNEQKLLKKSYVTIYVVTMKQRQEFMATKEIQMNHLRKFLVAWR